MINIVIPMAGRGSRFAQAGYALPKPLIELGGRPMIEWVVENVRPREAHRFHFICLQEHLDRYPAMIDRLADSAPGCTITPVRAVTEGAACTVLLTRKLIDNDSPLLIANSDQYVELDIDSFCAAALVQGVAGLIMTFTADHPKWSYCRMRENGTVSEVIEKQVVSRVATVGIYGFRRGSDFVAGADSMIAQGLRVNGEFYVAPVYNQLISQGAEVRTFGVTQMHGLGTPEDFIAFQKAEIYRAAGPRTN